MTRSSTAQQLGPTGDCRGSVYVEYLVLLAFLGLATIATVRWLASALHHTGDGTRDAVVELREWRPDAASPQAQTGGYQGVQQQYLRPLGAYNPATGRPTVDPESTIVPTLGAIAGGAVGFVLSGGVAAGTTVLSGGVLAPAVPFEVGAGTALGAAVGYAGGVAVVTLDGKIQEGQAWVGERLGAGFDWVEEKGGAAVGWTGERLGAGVDWVEERGASAVDAVRGWFSGDNDQADEEAKARKQHEVAKNEAKAAYNTNPVFKRWFHKVYKKDQVMPRGGRNNPDLDGDEMLDGYQEWLGAGRPRVK